MKQKTSSARSRKRQEQVEAGVFDGRYKTKIVPNKKRESTKSKSKNIDPYEDFPQTNQQGI